MYPVFILPGFHPTNKDWAVQCQKIFPDSKIIEWQHWQTGTPTPNWIEEESQKIIAQISTQKVNLLAKSIGTTIAGNIVTQKPDLINNIVFCGIPILDLKPGDEKYYLFLKDFPTYRTLLMQNEFDPHGKYSQLKDLFKPLNPDLEIVCTTRPDHEYPYFSDFKNFFS